MNILRQNISAVKTLKKHIDNCGSSWLATSKKRGGTAPLNNTFTIKNPKYQQGLLLKVNLGEWKTVVVDIDDISFFIGIDMSKFLNYEVLVKQDEARVIRAFEKKTFTAKYFKGLYGADSLEGLQYYFEGFRELKKDAEKFVPDIAYGFKEFSAEVLAPTYFVEDVLTKSNYKYLPLVMVRYNTFKGYYHTYFLDGNLYSFATYRVYEEFIADMSSTKYADKISKSTDMGLGHLIVKFIGKDYALG